MYSRRPSKLGLKPPSKLVTKIRLSLNRIKSDIHRDGIFQCIKGGKISVFMISLPGFPEKIPRISQCSAIETCPCSQHLPHAKVASNYSKREKQFASEESLLGSDDPFLFGQKSDSDLKNFPIRSSHFETVFFWSISYGWNLKVLIGPS